MATKTDSGSKLISVAEVAKHSKYNDAWVICNGKVFDVTKFISEHPGGENVLMEIAGTDCTENFEDVGHSLEARDIQMKYYVGDLDQSTVENHAAAAKNAAAASGGAEAQARSRSTDNGTVISPLLVIAALVAAAYAAYNFM